MPATPGRSVYLQTMTVTPTWDDLFVSNEAINAAGAQGPDGPPVRGFHMEVTTQACELEISGGLAGKTDGSIQLISYAAGAIRDIYAFNRNKGRITKIRGRSLVAGSVITLDPIMA